ncbi:MAG: ribbon-helix-helix domain-containing protein [Desulfobacterales bacterium]|jgi:metal-responsive CopG/Arc/MetJ family transcriptional regulator
MRTIQMTLDDELVESVDKLVKELNTSRSAFTRDALREAVNRFYTNLKEEKHRQGYVSHPANKNEFSVWEKEQDWGDE